MIERILLVEDDETMRRSFLYLLKQANYQVREATDGETALELLTAESFDVVVTDIVMGEVDGMKVLHVARQQPYRPEVIVLTGHGSFETAVMAVREGAFDYLVKPCDSNQFRETVARALQRHRAEQQVRNATRDLVAALYGDVPLPPPQPHKPDHPPPALAADEQPPPSPSMTIGALAIGPTRRDVTFAGRTVYLTCTEYKLLCYLARYLGQLCTSPDIVRTTHQIEADETEAQALVKPHIHNLRKKLHPSYFVTERGTGYRLVVPDDEEP
ncbi:MAG: response regulator transcription factor [Chloroflexaceae bacterium]|nr:response regulator transcription factor [Chloroflexaceae bacterium]